MPKRLTEGWYKGLGRGFEDSGWFLGTFVPITVVTLVLVMVIGTVVWARSCLKSPEKPKPCTDYSYKMEILGDLVGDSEARCTRWPAMAMRIEKRWVKADIVHCKCTPASYPSEAP